MCLSSPQSTNLDSGLIVVAWKRLGLWRDPDGFPAAYGSGAKPDEGKWLRASNRYWNPYNNYPHGFHAYSSFWCSPVVAKRFVLLRGVHTKGLQDFDDYKAIAAYEMFVPTYKQLLAAPFRKLLGFKQPWN